MNDDDGDQMRSTKIKKANLLREEHLSSIRRLLAILKDDEVIINQWIKMRCSCESNVVGLHGQYAFHEMNV